jgi:hypothetical protein
MEKQEVESGAQVRRDFQSVMPNRLEMNRPVSTATLPQEGHVAAGRVGSIEFLGAFYPRGWPVR